MTKKEGPPLVPARYRPCFSRSAFPSAIIFSISSGERGRRAVSTLYPVGVMSTSSSMRTPIFSSGRNRARDVGSVSRILASDVHQYDFAAVDLAVKLVVVQHGRINSGANYRRVRLGLAAGIVVDLHHSGGHLVFV